MNSGGTPYPMVAVGFFFIMFWVGYIVAHDLGMLLVTHVLLGLFGGYCAITVVDQIERRDPNA